MNGKNNTLILVGQVLIIVAAVGWCFTLIGMIWGIPMIKGCKQRIDGTKEITTEHIIISIIFFNWIGALFTAIGNNGL